MTASSSSRCKLGRGAQRVVFHTELNGHLAISGAHPYGAWVRLTLQTATSPFLEGSVVLNSDGLSSSGFLTGAPAVMSHYPIDFAFTLTLAPDPADVLFLSLEATAGGTAAGTEVNTAEADFGGDGWTVPHTGEVFSGLPAGVTVNIPSLNVVNNHWAGTTAVGSVKSAARLAVMARRNPVRGTARLALALPEAGPAKVEVFDVSGAHVATLADGWQAAGTRDLEWNTSAAHAGVYFARVTAAGRSAHTRLVVVR